MIRDLMIGCVESRFGTFKAPHQVQWLSDNGSIFTAARSLETATALGLSPCFTPVESPRATAWRSLRRDLRARLYVRVSPIPDAATALAAIRAGSTTTTRSIPTASSDAAHRRSTSEPWPNPPRVRPDGGNSTGLLDRRRDQPQAARRCSLCDSAHLSTVRAALSRASASRPDPTPTASRQYQQPRTTPTAAASERGFCNSPPGVHWMRNTLAHVPKDQHTMVAAALRQAFLQAGQEAARQTWRQLADQLRPRWPRLASLPPRSADRVRLADRMIGLLADHG